MARIGLYAGTFDPITNGHVDIIRRGFRFLDEIHVAIGINASKTPMFSLETRFRLIEEVCAPIAAEMGAKLSTGTFDKLVVWAARDAGASVMLRGLRNAGDFEYEAPMVSMNGTMAPEIETVFLAASPETASISSTLVRQIAGMGGDITPFVPPAVAAAIAERLAQDK